MKGDSSRSIPEPPTSLDELRRLSETAAPGPWQWLDSGGDPGEYDELQDGHGEQVATGFRDDINLDGPPPGHMTDGRFAAAAVNYVRSILKERFGVPDRIAEESELETRAAFGDR